MLITGPGLASHPQAKGRRSKESVLLTSELFEIKENKLLIGTARHPVGEIKWVAHREYPSPPKMITVWRNGDGSWALSFTCEDGVQLPTAEELLVQHSFTPEEKILALDAGVAHPLTDSEGQFYDLAQVVSSEVALCHQRKERLQGKLSRQQKGSKNRGRTKKRIARTNARQRNVLEDWRQKTVRRVVAKAHPVIGMEKLRLANLTAAPEPKPNPVAEIPGQRAFLPNGASAKAGLNKALLKVGLGQLRSIIGYKARRAGKAFLLVSPQFSSQECSQCTHISPDNRLSPSRVSLPGLRLRGAR